MEILNLRRAIFVKDFAKGWNDILTEKPFGAAVQKWHRPLRFHKPANGTALLQSAQEFSFQPALRMRLCVVESDALKCHVREKQQLQCFKPSISVGGKKRVRAAPPGADVLP